VIFFSMVVQCIVVYTGTVTFCATGGSGTFFSESGLYFSNCVLMPVRQDHYASMFTCVLTGKHSSLRRNFQPSVRPIDSSVQAGTSLADGLNLLLFIVFSVT